MPTLYIIVNAGLCVLLLCLPQFSLAKEPQAIPIYLPIDARKLKTNAQVLDRLLQATDLAQFKIKTVKSWSAYQLAIREGQIGVFLAAPHYSAWAVRKLNYVPLLRVKEPLKYVVAVRKNDSKIFELNDLKNRAVCTQKPLNLDYLLVNQAFNNVIQGAKIISVNSPQAAMLSDSSRCDGFAISEHRFIQVAAQHPEKFIRLHQSLVLNNYSFIAHPNIEQTLLDSLRAFLIREYSRPALAGILSQFARHTQLSQVDFEDYSDDEYLPLQPYW